MAKVRQIREVEFSKKKAFYWIVILSVTVVLIGKSAYDAYYHVIDANRARIGIPLMCSGFLMGCQWFSHVLRVLRADDSHIRIEGDKIIAFGKTFPKGKQDHIVFEKRGGSKLGYWTTLRHGDEELHIPLFAYRSAEEYVDAPDPKA